MELAGLRQRHREKIRPLSGSSTVHVADGSPYTFGENPDFAAVPRYTINLALPPAKRYEHVAVKYKSQATELPLLFDELVKDFLPKISPNKIKPLARVAMRRVYNDEENKELRGISRAISIDMWLLVAFNVLLDMFMYVSP